MSFNTRRVRIYFQARGVINRFTAVSYFSGLPILVLVFLFLGIFQKLRGHLEGQQLVPILDRQHLGRAHVGPGLRPGGASHCNKLDRKMAL